MESCNGGCGQSTDGLGIIRIITIILFMAIAVINVRLRQYSSIQVFHEDSCTSRRGCGGSQNRWSKILLRRQAINRHS
jgi:hypothetical protein